MRLPPFAHVACLFGLAPALWPWISALDSLRLWSLDMVSRYPIFIVALSAGGHRWPVCPQGGRRFSGIDFLGATRLLGSLATPGALLGEVRSDPNGVEEVTGARNTGQEEEVEEDADGNC